VAGQPRSPSATWRPPAKWLLTPCSSLSRLKLGDLANAEVERVSAEVTDAASTRRWTSCASSAALLAGARTPKARHEGDR